MTYTPRSAYEPEADANLVSYYLPPSAISRLDNDVLFHIFMLNTWCDDDFVYNYDSSTCTHDDDAMITARYTSQVCRRWRYLVCNSPTIWANTLHLKHLDQAKDEWRKEVLRHLGNTTFLSIKGKIEEISAPCRKFLFVVLRFGWHRVERMRVLVLCEEETSGRFPGSRMWESLCLPAPSLRIIWLKFDMPEYPLILHPQWRLFADTAPNL
ncbi:hypothetical protein CPC08DRAFT_771803 [Agrocybe pediades]|nr:hypothetical protein CPC08DRAFT_771803 [Agrocybe pediades]